ncbi:MAG: RNA 3'-terminal phosphate cyclase, partial [Planctomycetota bacterium]
GEGGGQVLRTSLSLAAALGRPVVVENVRGGRRKPGLLRQHRTALRAVRDITAGVVEGDELGSTTVRFTPGGPPQAGAYRFGIGSAGSTMLVLQTVLPPLLRADAPSSVVLEGGTHNPSAPPFEFFDEAFLPCLRAMGAEAAARLVRPGYFPGGGGELSVDVAPTAERRPLELLAREDAGTPSVEVVVDGLPADIAEREWKAFRRKLHWTRDRLRVSAEKAGRSPGNLMIARFPQAAHAAVLVAFGMRERSSEAVGGDLSRQVRDYVRSDAPVDEHLADQLMLPMALLGGGAFRCTGLSRHATTNAAVIDAFLPGAVRFEDDGANGEQRVTVTPAGATSAG